MPSSNRLPVYPRPVSPVSADPLPLSRHKIFYEAPGSTEDIPAAKRRRIEKCAQQYLRGEPLVIMTATLRGPFETWKNPWARGTIRRIDELPQTGNFQRSLEVPETVIQPSKAAENVEIWLKKNNEAPNPTNRVETSSPTPLPAQHDREHVSKPDTNTTNSTALPSAQPVEAPVEAPGETPALLKLDAKQITSPKGFSSVKRALIKPAPPSKTNKEVTSTKSASSSRSSQASLKFTLKTSKAIGVVPEAVQSSIGATNTTYTTGVLPASHQIDPNSPRHDPATETRRTAAAWATKTPRQGDGEDAGGGKGDNFDLEGAIDDLGSFLNTWDAEKVASGLSF